jgi:hypothetical protein
MESVQIMNEFKKNLVSFFDELIDQFPEEGEFVLVRILINDQLPTTEVINHFIKEILPHKDIIKARDERIFTEMNVLYFGLQQTQTNGIRKIWKSGKLDKEDRQVIWKWFDSFIYLVEKYQKSL